jgi:hypothetical protein
MVKRNFNGGGWSTARDTARGQTSRRRTQASVSGGSGGPTGGQVHGGGSSTQNRNTGTNSQSGQNTQNKAPIQTGTWGRGDPNDEKSDFIDYDYVSKTTGKTVGQMQAKAKKEGLAGMGQRADDMNRAMEMADKARSKQTGQVNLNALSDQDLEIMRDAGLFAGEAEGVLGGVAGIEQEVNKMKRALQYGDTESFKNSKNSLINLGFSEEVINKLSPEIIEVDETTGKEKFITNPDFDDKLSSQLGYDPTGMLMHNQIFGTEADALSTGMDPAEQNRLKWAYWGLTGDPSAAQLRQHLPTYEPLGYTALGGTRGGDAGGWSGWGSGGGGGDGGYYGYGPAGGRTPEQMAGFYTPQANLQQAMINVHQSPTVFKKRGGIVSLLRLS